MHDGLLWVLCSFAVTIAGLLLAGPDWPLPLLFLTGYELGGRRAQADRR